MTVPTSARTPVEPRNGAPRKVGSFRTPDHVAPVPAAPAAPAAAPVAGQPITEPGGPTRQPE